MSGELIASVKTGSGKIELNHRTRIYPGGAETIWLSLLLMNMLAPAPTILVTWLDANQARALGSALLRWADAHNVRSNN